MYHLLSRLACGPGLHLCLQSERGNCTSTVLLLARHESLFILGFISYVWQYISKKYWACAQRGVRIVHKDWFIFPRGQIAYKDLVYFILNIYEWHMLSILEFCELGLRFILLYSFVVHRSSFQGLHIWPEVYDHHQYPIWIGEVLTFQL